MPLLARLTAVGTAVLLAGAVAAPSAHAATLGLAHQTLHVADNPNDGVVGPGDQLTITETVVNNGAPVTGLQATLTSSTPGVTVTQGSSSYPDLATADTGANTTPLRVDLAPELACGTTVDLNLHFTSAAGTADVPLTIATGYVGNSVNYAGSSAVIGDSLGNLRPSLAKATYAGTAVVGGSGIVEDVQVNIGNLMHPDISKLSLSLKAPDGTTVPLVNAGRGGPNQSFVNTELVRDWPTTLDPPATGPFTGTFKADGDLGQFVGVEQHGTWSLLASETDTSLIGRVNSWTLRIAPADCAPRSVAKLTATPNPVDPGANVVLDATGSATTDPGGITQYEWDMGNGVFAGGPATQTVSFPRGRRTVKVRVSDANGVVGTASVDLIVSLLPNAVIALPPSPKQGTNVVLDGSGSNDPDGGAIARYDWELDGDDDFNDASGAQPIVPLPDAGSRTVKLRVTDADGATNTATATLNVIPTTPPTPSIVATPNPVVAGSPVMFDASGSTDDGTIVAYDWDLDGNGSFETAGGTSPTAARSYPNASVLPIKVRVTDDDGRFAVAQVSLTVQAPAGAQGSSGGQGDGSSPGAGATGDAPAGSGGAAAGGSGGASGGGSNAGGTARKLAATLDGAAIQRLKLVSKKGLGLRCNADRAATCSVTATLQPADAKRLGLSKSSKKAFVLGRGTVRLKKAGAAAVTVRVASRALKRLKRAPKIVVIVTGKAVAGDGREATLRRAILLRR
jgi:subtilisin-like proprotein convertase family protein